MFLTPWLTIKPQSKDNLQQRKSLFDSVKWAKKN